MPGFLNRIEGNLRISSTIYAPPDSWLDRWLEARHTSDYFVDHDLRAYCEKLECFLSQQWVKNPLHGSEEFSWADACADLSGLDLSIKTLALLVFMKEHCEDKFGSTALRGLLKTMKERPDCKKQI